MFFWPSNFDNLLVEINFNVNKALAPRICVNNNGKLGLIWLKTSEYNVVTHQHNVDGELNEKVK